uniref:type II toxin-antitoxin system RelE/ParE family toxin n=1 Tax=Mucilaginibacter sp. CSA2-8R TaxID=3141542 RepID=UPI00406D2D67
MSLIVFYTPAAKDTLQALYTFLTDKFSSRVANKFVIKIEQTIALLTTQPLIFKASPFDEQVRIATLNKNCSLFYRVTDTQLQLLYFWDNRQDSLFDAEI